MRFVPPQWVNTWNQWMKHIQDWCISRQLWWGHQIPAWYGSGGELFVARNEDEARARAVAAGYTGELKRDEDVLDTWYSAAQFPFSTVGWPAKTVEQDLFLPSTVLVTGHDIIFFWVARMIMMTTHFTGQVPFKTVYIHGMVRDSEGKKMSKSEGNVIDPVDLIDGVDIETLVQKSTVGLRKPETAPKVAARVRKEFPNGMPAYGADALRFTMASYASLGRNINFDTKRCEGYRNFCNKLWNATRFVLMNCEGFDCGLENHTKAECAPGQPFHNYLTFSQADRWISSKLQQVEGEVAQGFADFRLDNVANTIYDFIWNEFCDWYLEIAKVQIQSGSEAEKRATRRTLIRTLDAILRLAHPVIPFITEGLWQKVSVVAGLPGESVSIARYPVAQPEKIDPAAIAHVAKLKSVVDACRTLRSEMSVSPATRLPLYVLGDAAFMSQSAAVLAALAKLNEVKVFESEAEWQTAAAASPVALVGQGADVVRLCLHMQVDVAAEKIRLTKEVTRLETEIGKASNNLGNAAFVAKAPPVVLEQAKNRVADFVATLAKVKDQLARLDA